MNIDQDEIFNSPFVIDTPMDEIIYSIGKLLNQLLYSDLKIFVPSIFQHKYNNEYITIFTNYDLYVVIDTLYKTAQVKKFNDCDYIFLIGFEDNITKFYYKHDKLCSSIKFSIGTGTVFHYPYYINNTNSSIAKFSNHDVIEYSVIKTYNTTCKEYMKQFIFIKKFHPYIHAVWLTQQPFTVAEQYYRTIEKASEEATETLIKLDGKIHDLRTGNIIYEK
jgi:hypothetical protein